MTRHSRRHRASPKHRAASKHRATARRRVPSVLRHAGAAAAVAALSVTAASPAQAAPGSAVVRPGDTLSAIAASHGMSWRTLYAQNRDVIGSNPNLLRVGQVLTVGSGATARPAPTSAPSGEGRYVVRAGDTLSSIAARHGTTWQALHAANRAVIGANPDVLRVGQRLVVGQATAAARSAPASRSAARAATQPRDVAAAMVSARGWSRGQFTCLDRLWAAESGWRVTAENPYSGAYGIPQALPASKMGSAGADWRTNATTQISWGLGYIADRYGSPCGAWSHFQAKNWY